jgi:hypothetical protein
MMELLSEIESYLARTGLAASRFGRLAVGDPRFVDDLRGGRQPRRKTVERVATFLSASASITKPEL